MNKRPIRKHKVPLVHPAAGRTEEFAENFRRIYAGALADHRSLGCGQGVYYVRVLAPLVVTDDGVGLDLYDSRIVTMLAGVLSGLVLPAGTGTGDILYWDASAGKWRPLAFATGSYQVLQRKSDGTLGWDYVRAHG